LGSVGAELWFGLPALAGSEALEVIAVILPVGVLSGGLAGGLVGTYCHRVARTLTRSHKAGERRSVTDLPPAHSIRGDAGLRPVIATLDRSRSSARERARSALSSSGDRALKPKIRI